MNIKRERELIERLQKGDEIAREELITSAMKFAKYIARDYTRPGSFLDFDDFIQECNIGLINAVDRVAKYGLKGRFLAYATKSMRNTARKSLRVLSYTIKSNRKFAWDMKINKLLGAITYKYDEDMGEGFHGGFNFIAEEDHTPGRLALHGKLIDIMDEFLTLEEEDITKLRFGFGHVYFDTPDWQKPNKPLTREKVAKIMKISVKRVFVREKKALEKLQTDKVKFKLLAWL